MSMRIAAGKLAARGMKVFPIRAGRKAPPRQADWPSRATDDAAEVEMLWTTWPDDNIGIALGQSGMLVVDVDVRGEKAGMASLALLELDHGQLPPTLTAISPSGGLHLFFNAPPTVNTQGRIGKDIDTRGWSGYAVAVPSVTDEGAYRWDESAPSEVADAPGWLLELIGAPPEADPERDTPLVELDSEYSLDRAVHYLNVDAEPAVEGSGGNQGTYVVACSVRDLGVSRDECVRLMLEHYNHRCEPPWDDDELSPIVDHAYRYARGRAGTASTEADFVEDEAVAEYDEEKEYRGTFDEWVWVAGPKWFVRRSNGQRLDRQSFDSMFNHLTEKGDLSKIIYGSRTTMRKFMSLQFRPDAGEFLGQEYNLWKPGGTTPLDGDASWFEEHVRSMCGDDHGHVMDYLAWMVQRRGEKMTFALMIQGGQGIGKSWLGNMMERILGRHNTARPSNDELHGQFTAWAMSAELIVIEELMAAGRQQMANKLKPLITDPTIRVEEKYRTPYSVENHVSFLIFTNHLDPIPIEHDDRRYLVVKSDMKKREKSYYDRLWAELHGDGPGRVMRLLLDRDISGFNGKGTAPSTSGKEDMRRMSMGDVEAYLLERFETKEPPFDCDLVAMQDVEDCLPERLRRVPRLGNIIGKFVRQEIGGRNLGQHRVDGGRRRVLWSIRRHDFMESVGHEHRGRLYNGRSVLSGFT